LRVVFQCLGQALPGVFRWSVYLRQPFDRLRLSLALAVVVAVQGVSVSAAAAQLVADLVAIMKR
jgi:hypothetical protein